MTPNLALISDGKKFMWNGEQYDTKEEALRVAQMYQNDNFQFQLTEEEGKFLLYTRRIVQEVVASPQ
jgi:hypothetical protein